MASASYPRAVATAALQAALSSTWIVARELSPAKRRLARAGTVAAVLTAGYLTAPSTEESDAEAEVDLVVGANPFPAAEGAVRDDAPQVPFDKRKALIGAGVVALSVAAIAGRRQLEKRWLARLTQNGHPHPTRALAVRIAGLEFAVQLALQLADVRKARAQLSGSTSGSSPRR
ncbi:hypothetical protein [Actinoplanes sp. DH11]|uniref:hypothetical protein n=1 Tax=Actinoplanes sp. DH11 TaxID=2857011 RepID=UPI001E58728D|nr:hypothetical protein [Actinoplanes sp. DH11]